MELVQHPLYRLGARATPVPRVVRSISARARLTALQPRPVDWLAAIDADGDMLGNDSLPNCWPVARRWCITLRRAAAAGDTTRPALADVEADALALGAAYSATNGTDTSAGMGAWCRQGVRLNGQVLDIPHWLTADPADDRQVSLAILLAGPCMATWRLPLAMQDPAAWSRAPGFGPSWEAIWGEHETCLGATDGAAGTRTRSWGMDLEVHPEVRRRFMIGLDVPVSLAAGQWLGPSGIAPDALDRAALVGDMALLRAA